MGLCVGRVGEDGRVPRRHAGTEMAPSLITVETRRSDASIAVVGTSRTARLLPAAVRNLGCNASWRGLMTKPRLFHEFISREAALDANKVFVLTDAADFVWTDNCNHRELISRYRAIIAASDGARVVAGAELCRWPHPFPANRDEEYARFDGRRQRMLAAVQKEGGRGVSNAPMNHTATTCNTVTGSTRLQKHQGISVLVGLCACSAPPQHKYVNSGFLMGPASALRDVLACMLAQQTTGVGVVDDQHALTLCMFEQPGLLTLDYGSSLVLSLSGMHAQSAIDAPDGLARSLVSVGSGRHPCMLHFNGNSRGSLWRTVWWLRNALKVARARRPSRNPRATARAPAEPTPRLP